MIDKSARQYYNDIGFSKVKPSKDGSRPGYFAAMYGGGGQKSSSSGSGGGSPHGGGGGGGGGWDPGAAARERAAREANERSRIQQEKQANLDAQRKDPVAKEQGFFDTEPKKTYTPPVHHHGIDTGEEAYEMVGGVKVPLDMRGVKGFDPREDPERYFEKPGKDPFEVPEGERSIEDKLAIEDWEKKQDWDLIKDMSAKGYDFNEIQSAVEKGLTQKAPTTDTRRQNLIDFGLRNIMPETGLEKSLLSRAKRFMPDTKTGVMGNYIGQGKMFDPKKMATNYALSKMGLGWVNPVLGLASLFGFKNPFTSKGYNLPYKRKPTEPIDDRGAEKNVMQASIQKFKPTDQQTAQINEMKRKMEILQGYADKGALNERGMNTLTQMNQLINQYQVDPGSIYG